MSRWHLVFVALWALGLTMRGPVLEPTPAVSAGAESAAVAPLDAEGVARIMGEWNPGLSPVERERIGDAVMRCNEQHGLDPTLVTGLIWVESRGRPWARSNKGALGLMQVMPYMSGPMGLAGNSTTIESNVAAGCRILAENIERLGLEDGVSAYFWGGNIRNANYLNKVMSARQRILDEVSS